LELFPGPVVHSHLAAAAAFAAAHEHGTAAGIKVGLVESECFVDAQSGAQSTTMSPRSLRPCRLSPAWRITATISLTVGGSAG
jgi:hypothetical protein